MKKILFLITILSTMLFSTVAFAVEGEGTEESPFLITNQEELLLINDFPDCHFKLTSDIELEGNWVSLCSFSDSFTGVFDGNKHTISNLTTTFLLTNAGTIKNLNLKFTNAKIVNNPYSYSFWIGSSFYTYHCYGGMVCRNIGIIDSCSIAGNLITKAGNTNSGSYKYYYYSCVGGIAGFNSGTISKVSANVNMMISKYNICGGIVANGSENSTISDSYFNGQFLNSTSDNYTFKCSGIVYSAPDSIISNCYAVPIFQYNNSNYTSNYKTGISTSTTSIINSFYDSSISGISDDLGFQKTTLAMKMQKTYLNANWDFNNVWGISSDINNGYPYLLWEYANKGSTNVEIIGATATNNSLKFISEVAIEGEPKISTFGTTFIPLWLFESESTDIATVSYDNSNYNISNTQTYGAALTNIPESCKNIEIVGKSFIKDGDGKYTWSTAKYASVNNTILNSLE